MQSSNHFDVNIWDSGWFLQILRWQVTWTKLKTKERSWLEKGLFSPTKMLHWKRHSVDLSFWKRSFSPAIENDKQIDLSLTTIFAFQNIALKTTQRQFFLEKRSFSSDTKSLRSFFRISCTYCDSCGNRNTICSDCCPASRRLQEAECLRVNSRKRVREKHCINQV